MASFQVRTLCPQSPQYISTLEMLHTDRMSLLQSIVIPALLALLLYVLTSFVVLPLWRRHRARYAQYLPVQNLDFDQFSSSTRSLRARIKDALISFLLPFRRDVGPFLAAQHRSGDPSTLHDFDTADEYLEEDESPVGLPGDTLGSQLSQVMAARREAHEARRSEVERRQRVDSSDRRLSRDLEQGFMDSSDEEGAEGAEVEGRGLRAGQERWRNG